MAFILLLFVNYFATSRATNTTIPWKYNGFKRFPSVFFGASAKGLESDSTMNLISNHSIGGWGWQQNNSGLPGQEENNLLQQSKVFYNNFILNNSSSNIESTFVYRYSMGANPMWNSTLQVLNNSQYSDFWIQNDQGLVCTSDGLPLWNFSNETAVDYYLTNVIDQVITTNKEYINSVFFDEFDWITCSYNFSWTNCTDFQLSAEQKKEVGMASIRLFQKASEIMNKNGIIPILSVSTVMEKYINMTECALSEESLIDGLSNVDWIRYYESFPDFWPGQTGSYFFLNRIEEMKYSNIPVQIHSYGVAPNTTIDPYYIATFLMTQQEYSYFGASNGWMDENWSWHNAYNVYYGKPLMQYPMQINHTAYFRSFQNCNVTLDIHSRQAIISLHSNS